MLRVVYLFPILATLSGCAPAEYKKADFGIYGGRTGYLDKRVAANTYIVEYSQIGGYNYSLETNKVYWEQRARELCPDGYDGSYEIISPANARLEEFIRPQRFCSQYPLVSGVIKCH